MGRILLALAAVALLALVLGRVVVAVRARRARLAGAPTLAERPVVVETVRLARGDFPLSLPLRLVVEARRRVVLAPVAPGPLRVLSCDEGDAVRAGAPLARVDDDLARAAVETARRQIARLDAEGEASRALLPGLETVLAHWRREAERDRRLAAEGTVPTAQAEGSSLRRTEAELRLAELRGKLAVQEAAAAAARAELAAAERRLADHRLVAPFDGVVVRVRGEIGQMVAPGQALVELEDRSAFVLAAALPATDGDRVRPGQRLVAAGPAGPLETRVARIDPALDGRRLLRIEAPLSAEAAAGLATGRVLAGRLELDRLEGVLLMPRRALAWAPGGRAHAFVLREGRLVARPLTLLAESAERLAVEGLDEGDELVADACLGWTRLAAGGPVEVRP